MSNDLDWAAAPGARTRTVPQPMQPDASSALGPVDPLTSSVLSLQATAGNAAIAGALRSAAPSVQRQPKQPPPAFVANAQGTLKQLFPKEKLMQGVVIKDYAKLNPALQKAPYAAWTQSGTEVFIRDPALFGETPATQQMTLQYILQHEANHVRQFAKAKGPPKTWEAMARFELEAYTNDVKWLNGPGRSIVTDADLHKELLDGARTNLNDINELMKDAGNLKGKPRDTFFFDRMLVKKLIPEDATRNPLDLYKQP